MSSKAMNEVELRQLEGELISSLSSRISARRLGQDAPMFLLAGYVNELSFFANEKLSDEAKRQSEFWLSAFHRLCDKSHYRMLEVWERLLNRPLEGEVGKRLKDTENLSNRLGMFWVIYFRTIFSGFKPMIESSKEMRQGRKDAKKISERLLKLASEIEESHCRHTAHVSNLVLPGFFGERLNAGRAQEGVSLSQEMTEYPWMAIIQREILNRQQSRRDDLSKKDVGAELWLMNEVSNVQLEEILRYAAKLFADKGQWHSAVRQPNKTDADSASDDSRTNGISSRGIRSWLTIRVSHAMTKLYGNNSDADVALIVSAILDWPDGIGSSGVRPYVASASEEDRLWSISMIEHALRCTDPSMAIL